MWLSVARPLAIFASLASLLPSVSGQVLTTSSLNTCQENSGFTASLFNLVFTPGNGSATIDITAVSSIQGSVMFDAIVTAYGYQILRKTVDPCVAGLNGLCPMTAGKMSLTFVVTVSSSAASQIPGIAYTFPDLDANVKIFMNRTDSSGAITSDSVACVTADISNGKTVDLLGVKWATAIVAGLALASSAVVAGLGHSNAASHVASNALSLFGYFQAQAMVGLTAVPLPPAVQAWTQDFQWSMGIIKVDFMQTIFTWYQRATGGTPSSLFSSLVTVSVEVQKRGLDLGKRAVAMMPRIISEPVSDSMKYSLAKRGNIQNSSGSYVVFGIQRVAYRALIESTNLFMTGLTFFSLFVVLTVIGVAAFKGFCELAIRNKWMKRDMFLDFRNGWFTVLKGILFRLTLIGYPQMTILCMWEFTQRDSPAEIVLAVFFFFGMTVTLAWAASKVIRIARRSVVMHQNPAYILFSDPQALNKWGFLYVQFRASAYYFIVPVLGYNLLKGMFVALGQNSGTTQAVAFLIIEAGALIAASVLRPWMDKSTNSFNIAICVMNFLNAIFLLVFTDVFNQPGLVTGVVGIVLWIANAAFSLVLLVMLIVTTVIVFFRQNPDARYQFMADDRASFMKSQTQLTTTTELDALAATARGDKSGYKHGLDLDDDAESISSDSLRHPNNPINQPLPPSTANSGSNGSYRDRSPHSPVNPSMPLFPAESSGQNQYLRAQPSGSMSQRTASPGPGPFGGPPSNSSSTFRAQNNASPASGFRAQNNASPWQRGAGYDH